MPTTAERKPPTSAPTAATWTILRIGTVPCSQMADKTMKVPRRKNVMNVLSFVA